MIDGWNESIIEQLSPLGITCLYHITDKDNLPSILKERGLSSWKALVENGIIVPRPGGDAISHRLDGRFDGRDAAVHLYATKPTEADLNAVMATGRFSDLHVLSVSLKAIRPQTATFWIGDPYCGGEKIDNARDLLDRLANEPSCVSHVTVDVQGPVHIHFFEESIPADIWTRVSEVHPTAIVFVIDQSCSMQRGADLDSVIYDYISELVAQAVNAQIDSFLKRCISEDGTVSHLYDIAVIGYGDSVSPAWNGELADSAFHSPMELMTHTIEATDQFCWVDAKDNDTHGRCDLAFEYTYWLLKEWTERDENRFSYPPTVIHISDGEVTRNYQESFLLNAERLKSLHTEIGNVIVWNLSYLPVRHRELVFLSGEDLPAFSLLPSELIMYEASSYLPPQFKDKAKAFHGRNPAIARKTMGVNVRIQTLFDVLQMCVLPE